METLYRDLKAKILNSIYPWDTRNRSRGEATGSRDSDILAGRIDIREANKSSPREERESLVTDSAGGEGGRGRRGERASGTALKIQFWRH